MESRVRRATEADREAIHRAIYQAWQWRQLWSEAAFRRYLASSRPDSYVDDFGRRHGDVGFIAERLESESDGCQVLGAAWYRLFTADDHRDGYVAEDVPELVVAVSAEARGCGLGRALTGRLIHQAASTGTPGLSLHVGKENVRARHLYRSLGFVVVDDRGSRGLVMLKELQGCRRRSATSS